MSFVPLTEDEIERVRSVYKRHFSDGERLDTVCDMALASLSLPTPGCGHPSQYVYSEDGGAHMVCLLCERQRLIDAYAKQIATHGDQAARPEVDALKAAYHEGYADALKDRAAPSPQNARGGGGSSN